MNSIETIFWDFDGVILNSNPVRDIGFNEVLKQYPVNEVNMLLDYHQENGGLSRYVKFRYFFEKIRRENIDEEQILVLANNFSGIMRSMLKDKKLLISESIEFIKKQYSNYDMYIVSGSDQEELRFLCKELEINHYFKSIYGSPTPKNQLVKNIIEERGYQRNNCILVGDSINDFEAANANSIHFFAYNNPMLSDKTNFPFELS